MPEIEAMLKNVCLNMKHQVSVFIHNGTSLNLVEGIISYLALIQVVT